MHQGDSIWWRVACVSTEDRARRRLVKMFQELAARDGIQLAAGRITGPGHVVDLFPVWPGPGEDFDVTEEVLV